MNKREVILIAIADIPGVRRIDVTSDVPLGNEHMIQLLVYIDNERNPAPEALGIQASDGVGTAERLS